jgi:hypothetical protein
MAVVLVGIFVRAIPVSAQTCASILTLNWSGYVAATDGQNPQGIITAVKGMWTVPLLHKDATTGMMAIWVGVGGILAGDKTLIQAGVEANLLPNVIQYYVWYELFPNSQIRVALEVHAGDNVTVTIALVKQPDQWRITIQNLATGREYTVVVRYRSSMRSAEWIVEAPLVCRSICEEQNLPSFDRVVFTDSMATIQGVDLAIDHNWHDSLVLVRVKANAAIALTDNSPLLRNGTSFVVTPREPPIP